MTKKKIQTMKVFLYFMMLSVLNVFSQVADGEEKNMDTENNIQFQSYSFVHSRNLLNEEIWNRVSEFRFECIYLRLAVELKNNGYVLIEMDGDHRELAKSTDYNVISQKIVELTLRNFPLKIY